MAGGLFSSLFSFAVFHRYETPFLEKIQAKYYNRLIFIYFKK